MRYGSYKICRMKWNPVNSFVKLLKYWVWKCSVIFSATGCLDFGDNINKPLPLNWISPLYVMTGCELMLQFWSAYPTIMINFLIFHLMMNTYQNLLERCESKGRYTTEVSFSAVSNIRKKNLIRTFSSWFPTN